MMDCDIRARQIKIGRALQAADDAADRVSIDYRLPTPLVGETKQQIWRSSEQEAMRALYGFVGLDSLDVAWLRAAAVMAPMLAEEYPELGLHDAMAEVKAWLTMAATSLRQANAQIAEHQRQQRAA